MNESEIQLTPWSLLDDAALKQAADRFVSRFAPANTTPVEADEIAAMIFERYRILRDSSAAKDSTP